MAHGPHWKATALQDKAPLPGATIGALTAQPRLTSQHLFHQLAGFSMHRIFAHVAPSWERPSSTLPNYPALTSQPAHHSLPLHPLWSRQHPPPSRAEQTAPPPASFTAALGTYTTSLPGTCQPQTAEGQGLRGQERFAVISGFPVPSTDLVLDKTWGQVEHTPGPWCIPSHAKLTLTT